MIKTIYRPLFTLVSLLVLAACSSQNGEEPVVEQPSNAVNLAINTRVTRAITDASGITSFAEGDQITLYSSGLFQEMAAEPYIVKAAGELEHASGKTFSYYGTQGATFYAYYPSNTVSSNRYEATFEVSSDQSMDGSFGFSDLMTATSSVDAAQSEAVNLSFAHRLSLVKVDLSQFDFNVKGVELINIYPQVTWSYSSDAVFTVTTATPTSIRMGTNVAADAAGKIYWAVVPPQSMSSGNPLIMITTDTGKSYTYKPSNDIPFNEGTITSFALKLTGAGELVNISTTLQSQWGATTSNEDCVLEEFLYVPTVTAETPIMSLTSNCSELSEGQWGTLFTASGFEGEVTAISRGFDFVVKNQASSGSWHNRTLFYRGSANLSLNDKYKLTFSLSSLDGGQLWLSVSDGTKFYHLKSATYTLNNNGSRIMCNSSATARTVEVIVNPVVMATSSTESEDAKFLPNSSSKNFYIGLCASSSTLTTYTIKDITLVPYYE